jgi:hypothetical protein
MVVNIAKGKAMSADAYEALLNDVVNRVQQLSPEDQERFLSVLSKTTIRPQHSVLEFKGMGKELWQGIDVKKYIEEERNSWE